MKRLRLERWHFILASLVFAALVPLLIKVDTGEVNKWHLVVISVTVAAALWGMFYVGDQHGYARRQIEEIREHNEEMDL